jgi:hypothetical protein
MKEAGFARRRAYPLLGGLVLIGALWPVSARAQHDHGQAVEPRRDAATAEERDQANDLVRIVREVTHRFQDIAVARAEGYVPRFGCVSGSHEGAMGLHLVNDALVADGVIDARRPELLVYEPLSHGHFRLVAADYLILSEAWHQNHDAPPELMGQLFHLFDSPNRFTLPPFYTLHVWAWKDNPQGTFANWNPRVSCDDFNGQNP